MGVPGCTCWSALGCLRKPSQALLDCVAEHIPFLGAPPTRSLPAKSGQSAKEGAEVAACSKLDGTATGSFAAQSLLEDTARETLDSMPETSHPPADPETSKPASSRASFSDIRDEPKSMLKMADQAPGISDRLPTEADERWEVDLVRGALQLPLESMWEALGEQSAPQSRDSWGPGEALALGMAMPLPEVDVPAPRPHSPAMPPRQWMPPPRPSGPCPCTACYLTCGRGCKRAVCMRAFQEAPMESRPLEPWPMSRQGVAAEPMTGGAPKPGPLSLPAPRKQRSRRRTPPMRRPVVGDRYGLPHSPTAADVSATSIPPLWG